MDDWDFGVTTRTREPKPALARIERGLPRGAVRRTTWPWPRISVVCCSYNGAPLHRRLPRDALARQDYPDYEVIVIDDGSTDDTAAIASRYDVRLASQPNKGL